MLDPARISPVGLAAIAYELPGEAIDIIDYAQDQRIDEARLARLLANGIRYFHDGTDRADIDMVRAAIDDIIAQRGTAWIADVAYVIHARTQTFSMPAPPSSLLSELCAAYDLHPRLCFAIEQIACSGVLRALEWATRLMVNDPAARYALVITSDRVFGNARHRIRQDGGVQCDAGTALLVAREDLICRFGPLSRKRYPHLFEGPSTPALRSEIARLTLTQTRESLIHHARACGIEVSDFSRILPINADRHYWQRIADYLNLSHDVFFFDNISRRGHACCGDLALNLADGGLDALIAGEDVIYCGQSNLGLYENMTFCPPPGENVNA